MTEPMTAEELEAIREQIAGEPVRVRLLRSTITEYAARLLDEVDRLHAALVFTQQGAGLAVDAGTVALQEVKRLELERDQWKENAESQAQLVANWQWSAQQMRTERNQLKEINDRMAVDRERLITERDKTIRERDSLARRCYVRFEETKKAEAECSEWKERYINAGVEAELKIQRGWPDFRDTVAELDEVRTALDTGEASDGYHTFAELYEHRMVLTAHAVLGWTAAGYTVTKSRRHSDGELCFGGGWFIVTAELPAGQISYHYRNEHWDLFDIPEVETPAEFDGHTPADAVERMKASLKPYSDATTRLESDSEVLGALHAAGVDNWQGYEHAMESLEEDNDA